MTEKNFRGDAFSGSDPCGIRRLQTAVAAWGRRYNTTHFTGRSPLGAPTPPKTIIIRRQEQ